MMESISLCSYAAGGQLDPRSQERESHEFEDRVADALRSMGFDVRVRFHLEVCGLHREIDQLCLSDGGKVVWVECKLKRNGGYVGTEVPLNLWGAYTYLQLADVGNGFTPDRIWVVTNGRFSAAARAFCRAVNQTMEREFFVLVDGRRLERLGDATQPKHGAEKSRTVQQT